MKRIQDVSLLRNYQFIEDSGPMSHPIRPDSFVEINNFYTLTVYEKGAEIIRLYHTLLGPKRYRKATDVYFETYDGMAITTDEFRSVMETVSGEDLSQFDAWYSQSGTPKVTLKTTYFKENHTLEIKASQVTSGSPTLIPIKLGLLSQSGEVITFRLNLDGESVEETILRLTKSEQLFTLYNVKETPIISGFRGFSAPVYVDNGLTDHEKRILFKHDVDTFNRWDAGQQLLTNWINTVIKDLQSEKVMTRCPELLQIITSILEHASVDPALTVALISLPGLSELLEQLPNYNVMAAIDARDAILNHIICHHESQLLDIYNNLYSKRTVENHVEAMDRRQLQNTCLLYLARLNQLKYQELAYQQFSEALTMTDQLAALQAVTFYRSPLGEKALSEFYEQWKDRPLLMNKWLSIQVGTTTEDALGVVKRLEKHDCFDCKNPNKIRALYGAFSGNLKWFHQKSGLGYAFLTDKIIEIDTFNPSIASRLASAFKKYKALDPIRQDHMKVALERIESQSGLSNNTKEVVDRTLNL